ncbi:MAG TPA: DegT/DnrJ/EryC1/StrS family aminotransferase [Vicinamibacteria bacterium]|nr:DegT/DnrJ/EryC1/StrS family aminotransferase [Vicinamibacteria bacterium]
MTEDRDRMAQQPIPMVDLQAQYARIKAEVDAALARVIESAHFIKGEDCALFENEFAAYCQTGHACGVANGTDALSLALKAYGVGPGDDVVTVANTFVATGEAILLNGGRPVWVDVDPVTFTMDPGQLERAITPRTKVIVPVHLYGHPADTEPILDIAVRHGLPVLEDAAQAHGAEVRGRRVGSLGHAACFSFYPGKNLGAYGDAGAVTSNDAAFIAKVRQIANHGGGANKYDNVVVGTNSRLDTLQAAILRVKLRHLDLWNAERAERVRAYADALEGVAGIVVPRVREGARSAWHLFTIRTNDRDALQARLKAEGIATAIHYPKPLHLQPAMAAAGGRPGDLPVSEMLTREVLCLPLYPELPLDAVTRVASEVRNFSTSAVARA